MTRVAHLAAIAGLLAGGAGCTGSPARPTTRPTSDQQTTRTPSTQARPLSDALVRRQILLGYSVQHRPITAVEQGDPDSNRRTLIVGCIHGNEPAGIAIARALADTPAPSETDLWIVSDLNPDGVAARTRVNADGVDLNRNFPYRWQPLGAAGSDHYAGPRPLSEPESRIMARLLQRVRPTLGIWYHQALGVVDNSQGPAALERRYARATGLPLRALTDYPGSAVGFEDHLVGPTAFVVELRGGTLSRPQAIRHARAVLTLAKKS